MKKNNLKNNITIDKVELNKLIQFMLEEFEVSVNNINELGEPEFRIVMKQDLTCYAHVMGRDSNTTDFKFRNKTVKETRQEKLDKIDDKV